jgi:hypothetical protein
MNPVVVQRPRANEAPADAHDLPVLGVQESARNITPWESLMDDGVQPALILGAERRLRRGAG